MTELIRLKKVINWLIYKGVATNETMLAHKMGYTKSSVSQIVNGKAKLSDKFINNLCLFDENINKDWIRTGENDMFISKEKAIGISNDNHTQTDTQGNNNIVGDNNSWGNASTDTSLLKAIEEIGEQRKLVATAQEHINTLLRIIENTSK